MSSNYPPGVTGNEYAIAGPDSETEDEQFCPGCGSIKTGFTLSYGYQRWFVCDACETDTDLPHLSEPDYLAHAGEEDE